MTIRCICLFALLFLAVVGRAQNVEALDTKNGFRTLKFGVSRKTVTSLKFISSNASLGLSYYSKTDDKLFIGAYPVESITYCFYKEKLYPVSIYTIEGIEECEGILDALIVLYGEGEVKPESNNWDHDWEGRKVFATFRKTIINTAIIKFVSKVVDAQITADIEARERGILNDF